MAGRHSGCFVQVDWQRVPLPVELEHFIEQHSVGFNFVSIPDLDMVKEQSPL